MKKIVLLIVLLSLIQYFCYAQKQGQEELDSLLTALPKIKTDTAKINAWNSLSGSYVFINPDSFFIMTLDKKTTTNETY